jgi:hypothetical protein
VKTITARRRSAQQWEAEIDRMRTQYGVPLEAEAARQIITYLMRHFGTP